MIERPYKAVFNPALGVKKARFVNYFRTQEEAQQAKCLIARYTLSLHSENLMRDYSNFSEIYKFNGEEWEEIEHSEWGE